MSFKRTIFLQILQKVNREKFKNQVSRYDADRKTSSLGCFQILVIMIFSQIKKLESLRDIETNFNLSSDDYYHIALTSVKRSSLSDALKARNNKVFEDFYYQLLGQLSREGKRKFERRLKVLDSSTIGLCLSKFAWAKYKTTKSGIKLHTLLDYDLKVPVNVIITNAQKHDMIPVKDMEFNKNEIYTFDRGYNDYAFWYKADISGAVFVTRAKKNICYEVITKKNAKPECNILSDELIMLTGNKSNDYPKTLRLVKFLDEKKDKILTFITNDLKSEPEIIAEIYKSRWEVELFFKWIKQHLKIKKFLSTSENGVLIQIWTALITYLLILLLKSSSGIKIDAFEILRRIRPSLLVKIDIFELLTLNFKKKIPKKRIKNPQMELQF